jgi:hypothetical protein
MIKEYNDEIGRALYEAATKFVREYDIGHSECIWQCDSIIIASPELVQSVSDIVGYVDYEDDE